MSVILNPSFESGTGQVATDWTYTEVVTPVSGQDTWDAGSGRSRRGDYNTIGEFPDQTGGFSFALGDKNQLQAIIANIGDYCEISQSRDLTTLNALQIAYKFANYIDGGNPVYRYDFMIDNSVLFTTTATTQDLALVVDTSGFTGTHAIRHRLVRVQFNGIAKSLPTLWIDNMIETVIPAAAAVPYNLVQELNHCQNMIDNLLQQFKGKPRFEDFLHNFCDQFQDLEDTLFDLYLNRALETAVGAQLDGLGQIIGLERGAMDDDDYRLRLKAQIQLNVSSGTPEELLGLCVALQPLVEFELNEYGPASVVITANDVLGIDGDVISAILHSGKVGGVKLIFEWFENLPVFTFANGDGAGFNEGYWANGR